MILKKQTAKGKIFSHMGASFIWKNNSKVAGLIVFFLDSVIKGFLPIYILNELLNIHSYLIIVLTIIIQITGSNWSFFIQFHGGRGMAVIIGIILALNLYLAITLYLCYLVAWSVLKDGAPAWLFSLLLIALLTFIFFPNQLYFPVMLICLSLTTLKRALGNTLGKNYKIILTRIIYDRDLNNAFK